MALEKFCFCCKLENGAFIWGVLSIIWSAVLLTATISTDIFMDRMAVSSDTVGIDNVHNSQFWTILIILIINLISSILLIVGAVKRNHFMMLPWIIVNGIALIPFALAAFVGLVFAIPIYGPIYIWWCICSAYQKVQQDTSTSYTNFVSLSAFDSDAKPIIEAN